MYHLGKLWSKCIVESDLLEEIPVRGCGCFCGHKCHATGKISFGITLWVYDIYYENLWLFLLSTSLPITPIDNVSSTNISI